MSSLESTALWFDSRKKKKAIENVLKSKGYNIGIASLMADDYNGFYVYLKGHGYWTINGAIGAREEVWL